MKVLVAYDHSGAAQKAVALALGHAKEYNAAIYVVWSIEKGIDAQQKQIKAADDELQAIAARFEQEQIPCETHLLVRGMTAGEDLVAFADENEIDAIIIGIEKQSRVEKILLGSTAQYVILKARCPVLTVK